MSVVNSLYVMKLSVRSLSSSCPHQRLPRPQRASMSSPTSCPQDDMVVHVRELADMILMVLPGRGIPLVLCGSFEIEGMIR